MKKAVVFLMFIAFFMPSCSQNKNQPASPGQGRVGILGQNKPAAGSKTDGRITIGISVATDTFVIERWNKVVRVFSSAAQELGADVIVQLSAGGTKEQIAQINYLVTQGIDLLVVIPHDSEMLAGVIKQVRDAGIKVIAYDRMIQGVPIDAFVSFDSRQVGRLFGEALTGAVPRGRYLVVNGSLHDTNSFDISAGIHTVIDPYIASGQIVLEQEIWLEEWSFDEALSTIGALFEESVNYDAIACGNDMIAAAAIYLLSERRLAGKVAVVGQDAELISCQRIVEGLQLMTVYKPLSKLATRAAELAVALAEGRTLPPDTLLDNGSVAQIPSYIEKSIAVQKDNMDIVIRDGFHSREDVYRTITFD
jgi:D-xylose transport system substrate-binding protein